MLNILRSIHVYWIGRSHESWSTKYSHVHRRLKVVLEVGLGLGALFDTTAMPGMVSYVNAEY